MLSDRPTVPAIQPRHQPLDQPGRVPQRLVAGEPRRDPIDYLTKRVLPPVEVYPVCRGHRRGVFLPHKQGMLTRWPRSHPADTPPSRPSTASATHLTNYGCRTGARRIVSWCFPERTRPRVRQS
jgi:hypothetical protein